MWSTYELDNDETWPEFSSSDKKLISNLMSCSPSAPKKEQHVLLLRKKKKKNKKEQPILTAGVKARRRQS
ncbi:hypothetical protein Nmel_004772 [Mimus melanotis]